MKKEIYTDPVFEAQMTKDLKAAKNALQLIVTIWSELQLIPCTDLFELTTTPQKVIARAIDTLAEPPQVPGRLQMSKQAYIDTLELPDFDELFLACRLLLSVPYANITSLWILEGNEVKMNEAEAEKLIKTNSIIVESEAKIQMVKDLRTLTDLMNKLNIQTNGEIFQTGFPNTNRFMQNKWIIFGSDYHSAGGTIALDPAWLRRLLEIYPKVE